MLLALVVVVLLFQALVAIGGKGSMFTPTNITNLIGQNSYVVILATGMLLCILTGGNIDLSIGSVVALVGAVAGTLIVNMRVNIYLSIFICLLIGTAIGAWQGYWIAYRRIPAFIVTLAGMLMWRGVALIVLNGLTISPFPQSYLNYFTSFFPNVDDKAATLAISLLIGALACAAFIALQIVSRVQKLRKGYAVEGLIGFAARLALISAVTLASFFMLGSHNGIPVVLFLLAVIVLAYGYFTQNSVPGRHLYAVGGNEKAAALSGINTNKAIFFAYTNMAFLTAVAALVCVARFNSSAPTAGTNYEMDAIGACYIGGASAYGGTGTVGGAVIGAIFMGVLNNGMSILGIDANWQRAVKGAVLLAAVIFDVTSKQRKAALK
ncbi:MAG: sugar ABC transporter permease [Clostridiales bacterium]|nr:sugar ABC transporter permease [Clostridiales bacterium]